MSDMSRTAVLISALALGAALLPATAQTLARHDSSAPIDFAADRIEVQDRANRAVLSGNVSVKQGDMTLDAARLTVAYSGTASSGQALPLRRGLARGAHRQLLPACEMFGLAMPGQPGIHPGVVGGVAGRQ